MKLLLTSRVATATLTFALCGLCIAQQAPAAAPGTTNAAVAPGETGVLF